MEKLKWFFRSSPSDFTFRAFGSLHIGIILISLAGVLYLLVNRHELKNSRLAKRIIVYTLLIQQLLLYMWYGFSGYFSIQESLPLYNCRFAILAIVVGELFNKDRLKYIGIYWGLMGSILALSVPVLDPFGYDHYTFYSFFIGHIFLLWGSLYMILVEGKGVNRMTLFKICNFTNIYHILVTLFNRRTNANYCYLLRSPIMSDLFGRLPSFIYSLIVLVSFDIIIFLTHHLILKIIDYSAEENRIDNLVARIENRLA